MEKRKATGEFEGVRMKQDEDPAEYFGRMNKALQELTMLGGSKDEDEVNVHIVQNMLPAYFVDKNILLSRTGITRNEVEEELRSAYLTEKMDNIGMGGEGRKRGR